MSSIFDQIVVNPSMLSKQLEDAFALWRQSLEHTQAEMQAGSGSFDLLKTAASRHTERMRESHSKRGQALAQRSQDMAAAMQEAQLRGQLWAQWASYWLDASQRAVLTTDTLRKRGDIFLEHEAKGCPPVLVYDYEIVMDGRDQKYPSNYQLLKILPPEGVTIDDTLRPYIVIDPRAGHGPGIGGFKVDSQVGVALREHHPVYFVAFRRDPEPGQFLAYVTRSQAAFVREVTRLHPQAPKPVIVGNCQGGWATLLLAASNSDLSGPIVVNGAPVTPWAGKVGENPMRYNAGVLGGTWIPMILSDLGGGKFDGAHLVQNFELLNPSRTLFRKYTDLFRDIDRGDEAFLEFETWWGGFFLMNEAEIRWIVEQLFVGNRLTKNEARLEPGRPIDLKSIRAPIIVFASHGDNITPPQQALNWIADTYADVGEIRIRGQRIIYMVHEQVGHLGIFVSSQIANKEHSEVASTLDTIEALAPGLYEMRIEDVREVGGKTRFTVGFLERTIEDLRALDDGLSDERPFAAVARASEVQAQLYDSLLRPWLQATVTQTAAELSRTAHPQRLSRALMSTRNPLMAPVAEAAERVRQSRKKASADNPFLTAESIWVQSTEQMIDFYRDLRDMSYELGFFGFWANPWARAFGKTHESRRTLKTGDEVRALPEVVAALAAIGEGGFAEAVIRMLVLLAENRGQVRRDRLERASEVLTQDEPFKSLGSERRAMIIHQQTIIASFEPERAIQTLPSLLHEPSERELAVQLVQYIPGSIEEMSADTLHLLARFREVLDLDTRIEDIHENPLHGELAPQAHVDSALTIEVLEDEGSIQTPPPKSPRATKARKPAKSKSARGV
ncbi:MAG: DUF3141 domain-containing protein [Betaproteobacteria bacterium]|nr:DUF3141 domain-containing protein [Betaproteobacteria bacterium]